VGLGEAWDQGNVGSRGGHALTAGSRRDAASSIAHVYSTFRSLRPCLAWLPAVRRPVTATIPAVIRRAIDIVVSATVLAIASPILALAALAIRLESPGPVIYRQRRSGLRGREFEVLKLRTMVDGAEFEGAGLAINENDSRITRVGAFLRRTSLDELPNLVNVLRGEMSLIGPRPTLPAQVEQYTDRQRGRLEIKPGITGWAQVNGRAALPWSQRIELDLYYIEHRSLALDLRILRRTVAIVLGGSGTYKGAAGGWEGEL
jgi:lipopolysaccharide/colanic/teichoic acid biosynthesis glycosyltransferase